MIKLGTIGTSEIVKKFVNSAKKNSNLKVLCCYSRNKEKAKNFIIENDLAAKAVDSFEVLVDEVDAIYIASPNGLHYEHAKYFLTQQKHVLLEKPLTLNYDQACELAQIAEMNNVFLMEAYRTAHLPQFKKLLDSCQNYQPFLANFSMTQYSSRMEKVKHGIYDSVFDENLGKGSTYDMLIYPVELAIALFGPVKEVKSMGLKLPNGSGLNDIVLMKHTNNVLVNITCSKASEGLNYNEILSDHITISFLDNSHLKEISIKKRVNDTREMLYEQKEPMDYFEYEIKVFVKMILENDISLRNYLLDVSCEAIKVLNQVEKNRDKLGEIQHET
ncbi:Gfo/Idh/MocA family protein [Spiroplasma tabanidicola]|uniref:Gfo/Idh/MocA family oxidoreductase n=1 Tax=Spiroplasma tabanidicola TaxID=324079 RepID=A0A6I6CAG0_9MOLU|nr:Gfo/Idh/MocA family oxidoreductase [Spiroplasma tabanidicola]QGS51911.1 Gfo/Idh/MocA family oxidoreductase [Spiroplasma tabanidicola]